MHLIAKYLTKDFLKTSLLIDFLHGLSNTESIEALSLQNTSEITSFFNNTGTTTIIVDDNNSQNVVRNNGQSSHIFINKLTILYLFSVLSPTQFDVCHLQQPIYIPNFSIDGANTFNIYIYFLSIVFRTFLCDCETFPSIL